MDMDLDCDREWDSVLDWDWRWIAGLLFLHVLLLLSL
jgi:hypothetical protein